MPTTRSGRFGHATPLEGRWTTVERQDTPLLVCLHGGGFDSRYFDAPGCSLLTQASAAGFPVVLLNRPGYPAEDDSARVQPTFSEAAGIITEFIAEAWRQLGAGRPGIVRRALGRSGGRHPRGSQGRLLPVARAGDFRHLRRAHAVRSRAGASAAHRRRYDAAGTPPPAVLRSGLDLEHRHSRRHRPSAREHPACGPRGTQLQMGDDLPKVAACVEVRCITSARRVRRTLGNVA